MGYPRRDDFLSPEVTAELQNLARWCRYVANYVENGGPWVQAVPGVFIIAETAGRLTEQTKAGKISHRAMMPLTPERQEQIASTFVVPDGLEHERVVGLCEACDAGWHLNCLDVVMPTPTGEVVCGCPCHGGLD